MKIKRLISLLTVVLTVFAFDGFAQTKRDIREAKRKQAVELELNDIRTMIAEKNFFFQANMITWTDNPLIQNVVLNGQIYGIWVYPKNLNVSLPIYGMSSNGYYPELSEELEYSNSKYTFDVVEGSGYTVWKVVISSIDTWTLGQYKYTFEIDKTGGCSLLVESPFSTDVEFSGALFAQ